MKLITREIGQTILPQAVELIKDNKGKSHDEICVLLLQKQFVSLYYSLFFSIVFVITSHLPTHRMKAKRARRQSCQTGP